MFTFYAGDSFTPVTGDTGPRPGQTMEALAKLKPIFDRRDGTVTVGNSCQITDGAATLLLADAEAGAGTAARYLDSSAATRMWASIRRAWGWGRSSPSTSY